MKPVIDLDKEYGIVFEGGGARGAYQIGAWRAMEEAGLKIAAIAGTSVGALNGALVCMGDLEKAEKLWSQITFSKVMDVEDGWMKKLFEGKIPKIDVLKELWTYVKEGGVDITPLRKLIHENIDEKKIRTCGKEFCLTTFSISDMQKMELGLDEIPVGLLEDMLLASAYLFGFKKENLHGTNYMDGGLVNNVPATALVERGYKDIICVRILGPGIVEKATVPEGGSIEEVIPRVNLGSILEFSEKRSNQNMKIGYYDMQRFIYGLEGSIYYIEQTQDECYYDKMLGGMTELERTELKFRLKLPFGSGNKELFMGILEASAKLMQIPKYKIYTVEELWDLICDRYDLMLVEENKSLSKFVHILIALKREKEMWSTKWAGQNLVHFESIDSTNKKARDLGENGAAHGTVVIAESQTAGKGRRGSDWSSPKCGNIYMSILLRPELSIAQAPMLSRVITYSAAAVLREDFDVPVDIKWPNDLILGDKKIGGILTEISVEEAEIKQVVSGVGINLMDEEFPEELQDKATSIWKETGRKLEREAIIAFIWRRFEKEYERFCQSGDLSHIRKDYNRMLISKDREITVFKAGSEFKARALGVNDKGKLLLDRDGRTEVVTSCEISIRGINGYV